MRPLTEQEARQAIRLVREMSTTFKDFFLDDLKPEMNWVRIWWSGLTASWKMPRAS